MKKDELLHVLRLMYTIRLFEEHAKKLYRQHLLSGSFLGALHTYIGEEAVAVGVCVSLRRDDYIFSTHRGHGHFIAKGGDVKKLMAELLGKEDGCSRGRGGSMHLFAPEIGFLGGNGIVGAGIPLSIGAAYSAQYRDSDQVTVCFFGDGAASQGTFHESLNIASLWKLPVVFVCENNRYAVTTPVSETICVEDVAGRASGYGITGKVVDGNDVLEVHRVAQEAIERARVGGGPTLLECKTYRVDPHCMVISEFRKKEEREEWGKKDPILLFESRLKKESIADQKDFERLRREITAEIEEADTFAASSPFPDVESFKRSMPE
jgi:pyruvate dehydrogenase E1 component alpha subunit